MARRYTSISGHDGLGCQTSGPDRAVDM